MCVSSAVQVFSLKIILAVLFCVHYYQFSKATVARNFAVFALRTLSVSKVLANTKRTKKTDTCNSLI